MGNHFSVAVYVLASIAFFVDLLDVILRLYLRREHTVLKVSTQTAATSIPLDIGDFTPYEAQLHLRPYAIVASVHNIEPDSLQHFLAAVEPYRSHLWVIDDGSTDDTWQRLQGARARSVRSDHNRQKPGAIKMLLETLPAEIVTVVVLDPDARIVSPPVEFERGLFEFQRSGMAAACPRITIAHGGPLTRFQQFEYCLSFSLGRKALADFTITSGIAVYRRDALQRVLEQHSLSVYAEDLENAFLLFQAGERIYYDGRLVVETEGKTSVRELFSQRVGWSFGLLKVYLAHCRELLSHTQGGFAFKYQYIVYTGIFVLLLHPLKLAALVVLALSAANCLDDVARLGLIAETRFTDPLYFLVLYLKYTALTLALIPLAVPKEDRRSAWPLVPFYMFYAVAQIVPATVGYLNWVGLRLWGQRVYRDHYRPATS